MKRAITLAILLLGVVAFLIASSRVGSASRPLKPAMKRPLALSDWSDDDVAAWMAERGEVFTEQALQGPAVLIAKDSMLP